MESAKKAICQKEAVRQQSKELATSANEHLVEDVTRQTTRRPHRSKVGATSRSQGAPVQHPCPNVYVVVEESTRGMTSAQPGMLSAATVKRRATSKSTKTSQTSTAEVKVEQKGG